MRLYIHKNGQQLGPYSVDQVRSWLSSRQLQPTDLACCEGATTWMPLHTMPSMGVPAAPYVAGGGGWGFIITGAICTVLGLLLSVTIIGAIIGIPLFILGVPLLIYGRITYQRQMMEKLKESVRVGVVQGIQPELNLLSQRSQQQPQIQPTYSGLSAVQLVCTVCGEPLLTGGSVCGKCGTSAKADEFE